MDQDLIDSMDNTIEAEVQISSFKGNTQKMDAWKCTVHDDIIGVKVEVEGEEFPLDDIRNVLNGIVKVNVGINFVALRNICKEQVKLERKLYIFIESKYNMREGSSNIDKICLLLKVI